ncbi:MAG: ribosome maturation factor RimP [Acidaminococcaceae bacterium]|nr:ribosome maturation factor RimP [Acidaminococcaceae bacterium]MBR6860596.1 ribosome maturation factor RimP [Acidaminococcaceae bacterium]
MKREEVEKFITELVMPILKDTDLMLVDVEYVREKDWYLRIFIDKPEGVEIDDCQFVSEKLAEVLDDRDPIKEKYYLEVSSPGIDRPLKKDKDFTGNYGKKVDVQFFSPFDGNKELTGILLSHSETDIELKRIIKGKEEKNPIRIERKLIAVIRPHIDF